MELVNFSIYKDIHKKQIGILFGNGPTLSYYNDLFIKKDLVKVGTNEIVFSNITVDYYFIGDAGTCERGFLSDKEFYRKYMPKREKFIRIKPNNHKCHYSSLPSDIENAKYYNIANITYDHCNKNILLKDIQNGINDAGSISFEVLQFILYTGVSEIYLIGHDCDYAKGSFYSNKEKLQDSTIKWGNVILKNWHYVKQFLEEYYPNVSVYIINPKSLTIFPIAQMKKLYQQ